MILKEGLKQKKTTVEAEVGLHRSNLDFSLSVRLVVEIEGVDNQVAQMLVAKAHETCPYSKATKGNIPVTFEIRKFESI
jgi:organic hydroperoxide reductase OsmC/OhrA